MRLFFYLGLRSGVYGQDGQGWQGTIANRDQTVNVGVLARVGYGIRRVLGINLQAFLGRVHIDGTMFVGQGRVYAQRASLAGLVFNGGDGVASLILQVDGGEVVGEW